jgi:hypothetical protein
MIDLLYIKQNNYICIALLLRHLNSITRTEMVPLMLLMFIIQPALALAILISQFNLLNFPQRLLACWIAFTCVLVGQYVLFGDAAKLHSTSTKMLQADARRTYGDRILRRQIKACQNLKFEIGNFGNFFEKKTTLKCGQLVIDRAIDILLLRSG